MGEGGGLDALAAEVVHGGGYGQRDFHSASMWQNNAPCSSASSSA